MKVKYYTESEMNKLTEKARFEGFSEGIDTTIHKVLEVSQYVLDAKFGFSPAKLDRFGVEFNYYIDSILRDYLTFDEVTEEITSLLKDRKKIN